MSAASTQRKMCSTAPAATRIVRWCPITWPTYHHADRFDASFIRLAAGGVT
jgi:hypothetical protein